MSSIVFQFFVVVCNRTFAHNYPTKRHFLLSPSSSIKSNRIEKRTGRRSHIHTKKPTPEFTFSYLENVLRAFHGVNGAPVITCKHSNRSIENCTTFSFIHSLRSFYLFTNWNQHLDCIIWVNATTANSKIEKKLQRAVKRKKKCKWKTEENSSNDAKMIYFTVSSLFQSSPSTSRLMSMPLITLARKRAFENIRRVPLFRNEKTTCFVCIQF